MKTTLMYAAHQRFHENKIYFVVVIVIVLNRYRKMVRSRLWTFPIEVVEHSME